jgi:hypothetical protein
VGELGNDHSENSDWGKLQPESEGRGDYIEGWWYGKHLRFLGGTSGSPGMAALVGKTLLNR